MIYSADGTELYEKLEDGEFESADGTTYERCWNCGEYFPAHEMIANCFDGVFCTDCDEAMLLGNF